MFIIQYIIIGRKKGGEKGVKGEGGGFAASKKGARLTAQVGADCVGRLCRREQRPFGPRVVVSPPFAAMSFICRSAADVTGLAFVS